MYKCVCGKEFDTANKYNGHRSSCRQYLGDERYFQIYQHRVAAGIKGSEIAKQNRSIKDSKKLQDWLNEKHTCQTCGKLLTEYFGSGRFCNQSCANRFPRNHHKKVTTYKNDLKIPCPYCERTFPNNGGLASHIIHKHLGVENKGNRKYHYTTSHSRTGEYRIDFENITVDGMKQYKEKQKTCEICGKSIEQIKQENNHFSELCIDHNHKNNQFRGLLCVTCNRNLGWFENNKQAVLNYLNKDY